MVEIGDGQHPIHTCQRFQRTTAAIYQQRADLKRWGWWGGYPNAIRMEAKGDSGINQEIGPHLGCAYPGEGGLTATNGF